MAYLAGVAGLCFWHFRRQMRPLRWAVLLALMGLHLVMNGPVWSLIAHMDAVGGSSGYHRYALIDQFIRRFDEWWLVGTKHAGQWGYEMGDTSNQYVDLGVMGGFGTLVLFILVIVYCFKTLGTARKVATDSPAAGRVWALGAALFSHLVAFFGISYFDQTIASWYALLAMISAAAVVTAQKSSVQRHSPDFAFRQTRLG